MSYWICSFSNNQWKLEEEMGNNWDDSSFYLALRSPHCQATLMILDDDALPLTRSWCLFELLQTAQLSQRGQFQGLLLCTDSGVMNYGQGSIEMAMVLSKRLVDLRLEEATASEESDKRMIDQLISQQPGGFEEINAFLVQEVQGALMSTKMRFQQDLHQLEDFIDSRRGEQLRARSPALPEIDEGAMEAGDLPRLLWRASLPELRTIQPLKQDGDKRGKDELHVASCAATDSM